METQFLKTKHIATATAISNKHCIAKFTDQHVAYSYEHICCVFTEVCGVHLEGQMYI